MRLLPASARGGRRAAALLLLVLTIVWLHFLTLRQWPESRLGSGAADRTPKRIEVSFVRELAPVAAPTVAPRVLPPRPRRPALAAAPAASTPLPVPAPAPEPESAPDPEPAETVAQAVAPAASTAQEVPAAAEVAIAAPDTAPVFEWPPSTRLSYQLTGNFRGPVEGQATVEWLRSGERYQVHLEISIGPSFAPLVSRRLSSDGELTASGLRPRRYDEETKVALRDARRQTIFFEDELIRLPGGKTAPMQAGVQDTASQFVQLTWLFTTQPALLERGRSIELPLALPRYLDRWTYDVLETEMLATPVGPIETVHVKPRRAPRPGIDLTAEVWIAPSLQYLPVRILIRQDADTWVDLRVVRLPQQALAPAAQPTGR